MVLGVAFLCVFGSVGVSWVKGYWEERRLPLLHAGGKCCPLFMAVILQPEPHG